MYNITGTSHDEGSLRGSDNIDSASSFTVSLGPAGNLTHRRPASPSSSVASEYNTCSHFPVIFTTPMVDIVSI